MVLLHYSSYLIPFFFLITGIKLVFGVKFKNFVIRFFSLLIGLGTLNFSFALINFNTGLIGKIFFNIIEGFLITFQNNIFYKWTIFSLVFFSEKTN